MSGILHRQSPRDAASWSSDAGMGMVELLVSMMLSAVLLATVAAMFVGVAHATTSAKASMEGSGVAGTLANAMSRVIRSAAPNAVAGQPLADPAIVAGAPDSLTLYSLTDTSATTPAPVKVRFTVSGGQLIEERWRAGASGGYWTFTSSGPDTTRTLGGAVVPPAATEDPLFVYLDASGAVITPGAVGLTPAQRAAVNTVKVSLRVRAASSPSAPVTLLQNLVAMPNLTLAAVG
jgi:type II secretory pathway pseudopilin PulG